MLKKIKLLKSLNNKEIENLESLCQYRVLKKGEILFNKLDDANAMYLISKGEFEIFMNKDNKEVILGKVVAEDILGEIALFRDKKRMATARATKDSLVIILVEYALKEIINKHHDILEKINKIINERKQKNKLILE